jgi:hypothetical protein
MSLTRPVSEEYREFVNVACFVEWEFVTYEVTNGRRYALTKEGEQAQVFDSVNQLRQALKELLYKQAAKG